VVADHRHARSRRRDHRVEVGRAEGLDEVPDQRQRLVGVPRVGVHLPATRLPGGDDDSVAEALEHRDRRLPGLGIEGVGEAGYE
jgi:hypothetical protein